jgi:hypothetical protein
MNTQELRKYELVACSYSSSAFAGNQGVGMYPILLDLVQVLCIR